MAHEDEILETARLRRRYDVVCYMVVEGCQPDQPGDSEGPWFVDLYPKDPVRSFDTWEAMLDHVANESGLLVPSDVVE